MNNLTANTNLLPTTGFKLIVNSHEFANLQFFAVNVNLPGVTCNEAPTPFRNQAGFFPGEKLEYETLTVRAAIDEDFKVWDEIFNWMKSHTEQIDLKMSDITLCIMSSHNNVNKKFIFRNAFPTALGSVEFNVQTDDVQYAFVDITFRYDYYEPEGPLICP